MKPNTITALFSLFLLSACSTLKMQAPADIAANSDEITATERSMWSGALADERFKLGKYKVSKVDRDWDRSDNQKLSLDKLDLQSGQANSAFRYHVQSPMGLLTGQCSSQHTQNSLGISTISFNKSGLTFNCTCQQNAQTLSTLNLKEKNKRHDTGQLTLGQNQYSINPIHQSNGALSQEPAGYRFDGPQPIGAVELYKPGRIWLARHLSEDDKSALSCAMVGLMLNMPAEVKSK